MLTDWKYVGDVDLEYGGYFYRHDLNALGFPDYTDVIRVTDLDSATGANGLTLVEFLSTFDFSDKKKVKSALSCLGYTPADLRKMGKNTILEMITEAYLSYGYYDPWDEYYTRPNHFILVNSDYNRYSSMSTWEGWQPHKEFTVTLHKQYNGDLKEYIEGEWL
jgi:hypothetical protein